MLVKLAIKNIKYYMKSYLVYLGTISFNAWVYCTFLLFIYGDIGISLGSKAVYSTLFNLGANTILIFTILFIYYSTFFFIKKRKREIGMYMLLGVTKTKVGMLLLYETIFLGGIAAIFGILIGVATYYPIQKLMVVILGENVENIAISLNTIPVAILKFLTIFLVVSIINIKVIYKQQLIDLFKAEEKEEDPIKVGILKGLGSALILIVGYFLIFKVTGSSDIYYLPIGFLFVIVGIFLILEQTVSYIFCKLRESNLCATSLSDRVNVTGVIYHIRKNSLSWGAISILISISMSVIIAGYAIYQNQNDIFNEGHTFSYVYLKPNEETQSHIEKYINDKIEKKVSCDIETIELPVIKDKTVQIISNASDGKIRVLSYSGLKKIENTSGIKLINENLDSKESIVLGMYYDLKGENITLKSGEKEIKTVIYRCQKINPFNLHGERLLLVVNDSIFNQMTKDNNTQVVKCYKSDSKADNNDLTMEILRKLPKDSKLNFISPEDIGSLNITKILVSMLMIVCTSFLASTGSMLYFRVLSEIKDGEKNFELLRSIGADEKELNKIIHKQVKLMFILPYIVGSINTMMFAIFIANKNILRGITPVIASIIGFSFIYLVYYMLAVRECKRMIQEIRRRQ